MNLIFLVLAMLVEAAVSLFYRLTPLETTSSKPFLNSSSRATLETLPGGHILPYTSFRKKHVSLTDHKLDVLSIMEGRFCLPCDILSQKEVKFLSFEKIAWGRKFKQPAGLFQIDGDRKDKAGLKAWMGDPC